MPTVINLGAKWYVYAVIIVIAFFVLWICFGRQRNMEVVGLTPLLPPTQDHPITVSPRYADPAQFLPPAPEPIPEEAPPPPPEVRPFHTNRFRSIGEELTCTALEQLLGRKVEYNLRPHYLKNPRTGRNMEYDCFDPVAGIAVEYNGRQHSEFVPRYHRSVIDFEEQQYRDTEKARLSAEAGIHLIVISHVVDTCDAHGRYNSRISREERYNRIHAYLATQLQRIELQRQRPLAMLQE